MQIIGTCQPVRQQPVSHTGVSGFLHGATVRLFQPFERAPHVVIDHRVALLAKLAEGKRLTATVNVQDLDYWLTDIQVQ